VLISSASLLLLLLLLLLGVREVPPNVILVPRREAVHGIQVRSVLRRTVLCAVHHCDVWSTVLCCAVSEPFCTVCFITLPVLHLVSAVAHCAMICCLMLCHSVHCCATAFLARNSMLSNVLLCRLRPYRVGCLMNRETDSTSPVLRMRAVHNMLKLENIHTSYHIAQQPHRGVGTVSSTDSCVLCCV
jgi:hypothetical protein